jgi:ubiquinone/menaquinone biosynthesis C-methylase UbiE
MARAQDLQRRYYTETADSYDGHLADVEHTVALRYISAYVQMLGLKSVLDVGCGTGRALMHLGRSHPDLQLVGVEPVEALLKRANSSNGVPAERLVRGDGNSLPFADDSFDAVCEVGVLHHVSDPTSVVREMTRVARRAVFLSDINRFGRSSLPGGVVKLLLWEAGLWRLVYRFRTQGRGYSSTEGDGIAYSYSVYDSLPQLSRWAEHVALIPTLEKRAHSLFRPLLTASHLLVVALKDRNDLLRDVSDHAD